MKKTILLLLLMATVFTASAQDSQNGSADNQTGANIKTKSDSDSISASSEIYVGWNVALNGPSDMDTKIMQSWDFMITTGGDVRLGNNSPLSLNISLGVEWKNYRMSGNHYFLKDADNHVAVADVPDGESINFSRIRTFGIVLPVLLKAKLNKNSSIAVGPMLSYVPFGTILTEYDEKGNDTRITTRTKSIHQNEWTVDFMGKFKYKHVGIYVKYSPTSVIRKKYAPNTDFQSLSFGVVLGH